MSLTATAPAVADTTIRTNTQDTQQAAAAPLPARWTSDSCSAVNKRLPELARQGVRDVECYGAPKASAKLAQDSLSATASSVWCAGRTALTWWKTRTSICVTGPASYEDVNSKGVVTGTAVFSIASEIDTATNSTTWTEHDSAKLLGLTGTVTAIQVQWKTTCVSKCSPSARTVIPNGLITVGQTREGATSFSDQPKPGPDTLQEFWSFRMTPVGRPMGTPITGPTPTIRCDDLIGRSAGCVIPSYIPTMTTMAQLPGIAANIARVQKAGPHHYGNQALGGKPLTRTTDAAVERANRQAACPSSRPRPAGKSCDEYPFARTWQGASRTKQPDWDWAWVPRAEQNAQGGYVSSFYSSNRILNNDAFWVAV